MHFNIPFANTTKPDADEPWRYVCPACNASVHATKGGLSKAYECNRCEQRWEFSELYDCRHEEQVRDQVGAVTDSRPTTPPARLNNSSSHQPPSHTAVESTADQATSTDGGTTASPATTVDSPDDLVTVGYRVSAAGTTVYWCRDCIGDAPITTAADHCLSVTGRRCSYGHSTIATKLADNPAAMVKPCAGCDGDIGHQDAVDDAPPPQPPDSVTVTSAAPPQIATQLLRDAYPSLEISRHASFGHSDAVTERDALNPDPDSGPSILVIRLEWPQHPPDPHDSIPEFLSAKATELETACSALGLHTARATDTEGADRAWEIRARQPRLED